MSEFFLKAVSLSPEVSKSSGETIDSRGEIFRPDRCSSMSHQLSNCEESDGPEFCMDVVNISTLSAELCISEAWVDCRQGRSRVLSLEV